ncbi:Aquaporin-like domain-containing protein [Strongyloides ratti]|uniref:Aquaporin-like domain-containing protein n=1 Tax=Strongyloides ratti TaxID=34506 RepID=A0A090MR84_STRRB|nr:Aquaporin-like domain-containing protein [Strongyloides ratti]CEF60688.1 Aquaporin-like domain-containing protein [Strongyloides ratti]
MDNRPKLIINFYFIKEPITQFIGSFILSFFNFIVLSTSSKHSNIEGHSLMYSGLMFILIKCFTFKENCCFNPNITISLVLTLKKKLPIGIVFAYLLSESNYAINDKTPGHSYNEFFSPYLINEKLPKSILLWIEGFSIFILVLTSLINRRRKEFYIALSQFILSYISFLFYFNNNLGNIFMHLNTAIIVKLFTQIPSPFKIFYIHLCASLIGVIGGCIGYYMLQWNDSDNKSEEDTNNVIMEQQK